MKKLGIIVIMLLIGLYGCWQVKYPSGTWRYKLTLIVDDNGRQIITSSVRQVHVQAFPKLTPEMSPSPSVKGEAMAIDLREKGVIFVLLKGNDDNDYGYRIVFSEFPSGVRGGTTPEGIKFYSQLKAKNRLDFNKIPMLVHFQNINDKKTVELVDPYDLEKTFGKGVKLVSATLEMTDEAVTIGKIQKYLLWIDKWRKDGGTISGKVFFDTPPSPETILIPMNFIQG